MSSFTHLHVHSHYSLLNALPKIKDLVKTAKKMDMKALALTDSGNLYGAIEFYKECEKQEIKPIIGVDFYVSARTRHDKEAGVDNRRTRLVLLAKNIDGYKNLIKLVTYSHLEGFYYKPRVDRELLEKYKDGLICIVPSFSGDIIQFIAHNSDEAKTRMDWYKKNYGDENVYLEITHHPEIEGHENRMEKLIDFAKETKSQIMAAHDVYYLNIEDREARETLLGIQGGTRERGGFDDGDENFSFITEKEANKLFKKTPEALLNTEKIANECNVKLELGSWVFPNFLLEDGSRDYDKALRNLAEKGLAEKGLINDAEAKKRLDYELDVIKTKGYAPYFLVVGDLLRHAKENQIYTTIRGSVAGSLTTYLVGITKVNPLEYKLPFERFLNPERPSAPDIDMDYADNRRDEMLEYARAKYGENNVAQIGTFGTMMARGAVRDVARALGFSYGTGDRIAKLIPMGSQGFPMTISHAIEITEELRDLYKKDPETKRIIDMAKKIEGCARHISVHAAGVVISPTDLTDFVPLQIDPKGGKKITQYDMHAVEDAGLLKFDFLGIRNLSILAHAVNLVRRIKKIEIDIEKIPVDDPKTFEMLARGETVGLFQLNGAGMTKFLIDLKPSTIHDINAMVALYRPGPMESIPEYISRKHNPRLVRYLDPRLKDILDQSYGVITYQDDVMMIAIKLGGYSWLEADKLRKAMGKKIPEEMEAQKVKLHDGLIKNGLSESKAEELWKLIEPFAAYGFNKAHAASYGRVAYQTAYMKANFPVIYMASVLTAESGDVDKISEIVAETKRMGIPVLPPDINESFGDFTVVPNDEKKENETDEAIRFGLHSIKNLGEGISDVIIENRKEKGPFISLANFLSRVTDKNLNKKSLESLIKCGAMDAFGERGKMLANLDSLLAFSKEQKSQGDHQDSLFNSDILPELRLADAPSALPKDRLAWEKELLGLYISGHPLHQFKDKFEKRGTDITKIKAEAYENMETVIAGIITEFKEILTKKGDKMAFVTIADMNDSMEAVIFPRVLAEFGTHIHAEACVAMKGKISKRNGSVSFIAEKIKAL